MKRIFVVTTVLLLFSILGLAARGGPDSTPVEASSTPAGTPPPNQQVEMISGPVSPLIGDQVTRVVTVSQPAPTPDSVSFGDPRSGEKLFVLACGKCHGRRRDGSLNVRGDVMGSESTAEEMNQELFEIIKTGRKADGTRLMPPKGGSSALTDENLYDIVAFIRSLDH